MPKPHMYSISAIIVALLAVAVALYNPLAGYVFFAALLSSFATCTATKIKLSSRNRDKRKL